MTNVTVTFKGNPGTGKSELSKLARDTLASLGFLCSEIRHNDAHNNESFVVQNPRKTLKGAGITAQPPEPER